MIWRAGILPAGYEAWLFLPLLASVYGFCQVQAKTDDGYFLGFPSLWNLVALYLYALPFGSVGVAGDRDRAGHPDLRAVRYLYPSQPGKFNRFMSILGIPWTIALVWLICNLPDVRVPARSDRALEVAWASLSYPVLYLGVSWVDQRGSLVKRKRIGRAEPG